MSEIAEEEIARAAGIIDPEAFSPHIAISFRKHRQSVAAFKAHAVLALLQPALERARREGLEAAAQYLEACDDHGDRYKAAEIRAIRKGSGE